MFSGKIEESLDVHQRHKVVDIADGCGYRVHPADPPDPADHVFRRNKHKHKVFRICRQILSTPSET